jgi:ABC-2 type transport system permease protein
VSRLVRAELLKLRTVRLPLWLLVTTLLLVALSVTATLLTAGAEGSPIRADDPELLARAVSGASAGNVLLAVLGILVLTQEFRFGTATSSFLTTPRRSRVVVAKLVAVVVAGALFAVVSVLVALGLGLALASVRGLDVALDRSVLEVLAACLLVLVLYGPIGVGVGALVRNQVAAVVATLAWMFVVEQLLVALLPEVGRWTPGGATASVLQLGDVATLGRGDLLPVWGGALLLVAYAVALSAAGAVTALRRDLT